MTIKFAPPREPHELKPRITVIGAGGGGCNAVNNMIRSKLEGVEFVVANSDAQALQQSLAERKIQLGTNITQGLGAGSRPDIGRAAAEESIDEIVDHLQGTHMAFITVGLGGGTGTGSAPVIAQAARDMGILTVAVVTKPFHFEGARRMEHAELGLTELEQYVDTLIVIPNQNLFRVANEKTTFADAFKMADDVLYAGVRGVTDLMIMPGLINLDFADIRTVMSEMGKAMMGTGEAEGDSRALDAAEAAISNPLLDDISMKGARGVLINITGGMDMTLFEVDEAANRIRDEVDPNANIIFGSTFDEALDGKMRVSVVSTGIHSEGAQSSLPKPQPREASAVGASSASRSITGRSNYRTTLGSPRVPQAEPAATANTARATGFNKPAFEMPKTFEAEPTLEEAQNAVPEVNVQQEPPQLRVTEEQTETFTSPANASLLESSSEEDALQEIAFVPPAPVEVPDDYEEPTGSADPFAAAAMANAGGRDQQPVAAPAQPEPVAMEPEQEEEFEEEMELEPARPMSLFERMSNFGRRSAPAEPAREPRLSTAPKAQQVQEQEELRQPRLEAIDTVPQPVQREEEDLLEIPAFLRRQAN